jgi:hypothetical protein
MTSPATCTTLSGTVCCLSHPETQKKSQLVLSVRGQEQSKLHSYLGGLENYRIALCALIFETAVDRCNRKTIILIILINNLLYLGNLAKDDNMLAIRNGSIKLFS